MPIFTETKTLTSLKLVPALDIIITEHEVATLKDGVVITKATEGRSYSNSQIADFEMTITPSGAPLSDIVASFNAAAIEQRDAAVAAKVAAQAALTTAQAQVAALQAQIDAYTPPTPTVDAEGPTVDDLQIRLALNAMDLRAAVEAAVAQSDQSTKDWWARANNFKRKNPLVITIGRALGKTDDELDGLWALAATLG